VIIGGIYQLICLADTYDEAKRIARADLRRPEVLDVGDVYFVPTGSPERSFLESAAGRRLVSGGHS